jgi:hypothetical protein
MQDKGGPASQAALSAQDWRSPDFVNQLRLRVAGMALEPLLAGNITLLGLDRVKARFGSRWTAVAERVHRITRNTIARHLVAGDIYTSWRETNYIILFGNLPQAQAQMKCALIAAEVARALLGEEGAEDLGVKDSVTALDGRVALAEMPSITEWLEAALAAPAAAPRADGGRDPAASGGTAAVADAAAPRFLFRPVWDPTLSALSTYRCTAIGEPSEDVAAIDALLQKRALRELADMKRDGRKLLLILPVQFETLAAGGTRRSYAEALAEGVASDAAKFLVIELLGVPSGVPHARLIELLAPLRRRCRAFVARVAIEIADLTAFKGTGVHAVGCDLGETSASELMLMQLMARFQRVAERAELATFIRGLRSHSLAAAALGAGFRYLEGDGIAKAVARPDAVREFRLFDVYRPLVEA